MVGMNVFYFVIGFLFGGVAGYFMGIFNKCTCDCPRFKNFIKFIIMLIFAIGLPFGCHYTRFEESKYIGIIFYGYFSYQVWGEEKPDELLANFWVICQPFLFSSVGASIILDNIDVDVFGKSCLFLVLGVVARWMGTFIVTGGDQGFTCKERAFFAFAWIPKATVQAAIGGIVLDNARNLSGVEESVKAQYLQFGNIVLTMAVLSIIMTAPLGAILINTLGVKWLSDDSIYEVEVKPGDNGQSKMDVETERELRPTTNGDINGEANGNIQMTDSPATLLKEGSQNELDNGVKKFITGNGEGEI